MPRRNRSIALTLSIALVGVTTLVHVFAGVEAYRTRAGQMREQLRDASTTSADQAAVALALPIWSFDRAQIDKIVESIMRERDIFAVVVSVSGKNHAMIRDQAGGPVPFDGTVTPDTIAAEGLLHERRAVTFAGDSIGEVSIFVTPRFQRQELRTTLISMVTLIAVIDTALVVLLALFFWRMILRPLRAIEQYAEVVSSGNRPAATPSGTRFPGEIDRLRTSIERMVGLLDQRYAERKAAEDAIHALAARLQAAREEEQTRIARDLHDELGQLLTGLKIDLRWVEQKLSDLPPTTKLSPIVDHVVEASSLIDQTVATVQRIAADLRPSALDRLGLAAALRHEVRRFRERTGIECVASFDEPLPDLSGDAATVLYRIAQEALTNVARHAGASRVAVTLRMDLGAITLRVEDDGAGIGSVTPGTHALGLLGMRERAAILGGSVTFARGVENGTVVTLTVPLARVVVEPILEAT